MRFFLNSSVLLLLVACTEPGQMTGVGAATGGVVGAGLGAMIGNQTGDAGSGLAIGAVAGAGAGAAVGNVLEAQDQAIHQQDEAIERQEQVIRAQRGELDQLRRLGQDSVRFRGRSPVMGVVPETHLERPARSNALVLRNVPSKPGMAHPIISENSSSERAFVGRAAPAAPLPVESAKRSPVAKVPELVVSEDLTGDAVVAEVDSVDKSDAEPVDSPARIDESNDAAVEVPAAVEEKIIEDKAPAALAGAKTSADCLSAEQEFQQAATKNENPDKLFHIRRALRLCPDDARFHTSLGDIYTSLGRPGDAKFEYQEASKLSPGNQELKGKIEALSAGSAEKY